MRSQNPQKLQKRYLNFEIDVLNFRIPHLKGERFLVLVRGVRTYLQVWKMTHINQKKICFLWKRIVVNDVGQICHLSLTTTIGKTSNNAFKTQTQHGKEIFEMVCDPSVWHIEHCKTLSHCLALQINIRMWCTILVYKRGSKGTSLPSSIVWF